MIMPIGWVSTQVIKSKALGDTAAAHIHPDIRKNATIKDNPLIRTRMEVIELICGR